MTAYNVRLSKGELKFGSSNYAVKDYVDKDEYAKIMKGYEENELNSILRYSDLLYKESHNSLYGAFDLEYNPIHIRNDVKSVNKHLLSMRDAGFKNINSDNLHMAEENYGKNGILLYTTPRYLNAPSHKYLLVNNWEINWYQVQQVCKLHGYDFDKVSQNIKVPEQYMIYSKEIYNLVSKQQHSLPIELTEENDNDATWAKYNSYQKKIDDIRKETKYTDYALDVIKNIKPNNRQSVAHASCILDCYLYPEELVEIASSYKEGNTKFNSKVVDLLYDMNYGKVANQLLQGKADLVINKYLNEVSMNKNDTIKKAIKENNISDNKTVKEDIEK